MIDHISPSMVNNYLLCKRKWYYHYGLGIRIRNNKCSAALKMGKLLDTAMNVLYGYATGADIVKVVSDYEIDAYDVAKVKGVYDAYKELIAKDLDGYVQQELSLNIDGDHVKLIGILDRLYLKPGEHYFIESKFTSSPDFYLDPFFLTPQIGSYFLLHRGMSYCIMQVVRKPELKVKEKENETAEQFKDRIYGDVLSQPSRYLIGFNRDNKTFGKKFYPQEFNVKELGSRYIRIWDEIRSLWGVIDNEPEQRYNHFYKSETGCNAFNTQCEYISICKNGWMMGEINDDIYYTEEKF